MPVLPVFAELPANMVFTTYPTAMIAVYFYISQFKVQLNLGLAVYVMLDVTILLPWVAWIAESSTPPLFMRGAIKWMKDSRTPEYL
jgi:hypothetical protein